MRTKQIILFTAFLIISVSSFGQRWKLAREEIFYGAGTINYFGDIGGAEDPEASALADFDLVHTRPNISIGYRYRLTERLAAKGSIVYANIHGSDVGSKNEGRNFTFTSNMFQLYGHVEYHITPETQIVNYSTMSLRGGLNKLKGKINFYAFAGLGVSYFKPTAFDSFQGSERFVGDKNIALSIPLGLGLKYPIASTMYIGFELSGNFTTTDYLDGFSPESSNSKDLYYLSVIYVSYKIKNKQKRKRARF